MWFWLALIALLCWSGSDLFSKIGCRGNDKYAHLKMVIAVGIIMGVHALYEMFAGGVDVTWHVILTYLPVSLLYISSMTLGYIGLRYIELSISSPICNSSGALVAVLCFITGTLDEGIEGSMRLAVMGAVALVCAGVIGLGIAQECSDYAASAANCAYELTFLFAAICCIVYVGVIKKQKFTFRQEGPKYFGAICETAGQFAYIFALSDTAHAAISAPIISAYCVASVVWSRIFLKEKLSWKHYAMILLVVIGIVMLGVFDI